MYIQLQTRTTRWLLLLVMIVILSGVAPVNIVQAQQTPFLTSPYYGNEAISAYFDHDLPNYNENNNFRLYDGRLWINPPTPVDRNHCNMPACYDGHDGIDFALSYEPVIASASGYVTRANWSNPNNRNDGWGLVVEIRHSNNYTTRYAHLSAVGVQVGQYVNIGDIIGTSGNTGSVTGNHLHFGVLNPTGWRVDPFGWSGAGADPWQVESGATSWCMWVGGQWANICNPNTPGHPIPEPPISFETIIDDNPDNNSGFSKGRGNPFNLYCPPNACPNWTRSTTTGHLGDMYFTTTLGDNADYWARWQPGDFPGGGGLYEIWVYVPDTHATTWRARYTVRHDNGAGTTVERTAVVDQFGLSNRWVSIGFYAMRAGDYVYTTSATGTAWNEPGRELAVDAIRFSRIDVNYVPLYKFDNNWFPTLTARNNGGPTTVRWVFYNSNGTQRCLFTRSLPPNAQYAYSCAGASAVVVEATQDVAVSFLLQRNTPFASAAYVGVENPVSNGTVPLVHRNNYGWYSEISLQNTTNVARRVQLAFQPPASCSLFIREIPANGTLVIDTANESCLGSNYVGSVRVERNLAPLAVADIQYHLGYDSLIASAAVVNASGTLYAPLIQQNNYGWTSGFNLQNATNQYHVLTAAYYRQGGATCPNLDQFNVGPYRVVTQYPAPSVTCSGDTVLSARFYSGGLMNGQVNQIVLGDTKASGYRAIANPTTKAVVPYVRRDSTWGTGLQIRNTSLGTALVIISYYDQNGNFVSSDNRSILPSGTTTIYPIQPAAPFYGSAMVECTNGAPLAVAVNHLKIATGATGDTIMSHIAPNR